MSVPEVVPARPRSGWVRLLRLAVSAGLLAFLITKIDFEDMVPQNRSLPGTIAFLVTGILLMGFSLILAAWRWQRVLDVFDVHVPLRRLVSHYFAGQFVGNVLPSTVGGDVLRVTRTARDIGAPDVAFASVVLERLTGFVALPFLLFLGFVADPSLFTAPHAWIALLTGGATIAMLVVIIVVAGHPNVAGRFTEHENWMRYIGAIHVGIDRLRRDPRDAAAALGAAVAYQFVVVSAVYCAVHTVGLTVPNAAVLAYVPAVAMAQVLPISVGGFGLREGMLALLLHPLGAETSQAVAVGLLWYAMMLIVSLGGAPAFAIGDRTPAATGGET
ncbi:MAG TPA: lysylphosphatidylglycerol synthase transmembrane domain-containing protein [Acidimicrobiia bacterium]|nr:lysylphosphatidylglycerol synthase transmembrane domain-containing protein [Acidimicrobiia bacterium]